MSNSPALAQHLVDVIRHWAGLRPEHEVLRFYPQGEGDYITRNFAELHSRCQAIAAALQPYHGQRALLLFNSGIEFLEALFGCFYAGVIAVPAYPPRRNQNIGRLASIVADCTPAVVLSSAGVIEHAQALFADAVDDSLRRLPWLDSDQAASGQPASSAMAINASDIAFLQYTSGSTGTPKGVMVSHCNLMTNIRMAEQAFGLDADARCVSWLPLFHDMGLIGAVMTPLYWGAGAVLMPPAAFLQKPLRWLQLMHEFGKLSPVGCPAPNFSYQLCVDHVSDEQAANLDLSNWVFALTGAEPIRAETIEAFCSKFAISGFRPEALVPSYGMAECTLLSTCRQHQPIQVKRVSAHQLADNRFVETDNGSLRFVSAGSNCPPQTLRIVDPESLLPLSDGKVGEIWLAGDHIAAGYWGQPELSEQTFHAVTADGEGPFLRTGDLGTVLDQQLYVTGRLKDLLIIRGRNHYPQDIEWTVAHAAEGLQADHGAAFTIEQDNEEKLVVVQELQRSHQRQFDAGPAITTIRNAIAREHGLELHAIHFIRFASIAKTSSGKIRRHVCRQQYLDGTLNSIASWQAGQRPAGQLPAAPSSAPQQTDAGTLEQWIAGWLAAKTGNAVDDIPLQAPLDGLGLDSVDLVQLSGELESWLGQPLDHTLVWEQPHIRALAARIIEQAQQAPAASDDNGEIEGFI
ncbi:MAG TPA: AMP-binding protein [Pseudomonadales bacterium]